MLQVNKIAALLGSLILISSVEASTTNFSYQTINDPKDPTFNQLLSINNAGTIAGYFGSGATGHPNQGYTITPSYVLGGVFTDENFTGSIQTQVVGINDNGLTIGFFVDQNDNNFGFVHNNGVFTKVVDPLSPLLPNGSPQVNQLLAVNDKNLAAGFYNDANGNSQAYTYDIKTTKFSPINIGATSTTAAAINNADEVGGFYVNGKTTEGFILSRGKLLSLQYPNASSTMVLGLNNTGSADGVYTDSAGLMHGFLYSRATKKFTPVDAPNAVGGTTLNGLNDKGQLTGFYVDNAGNTNGLLVTVTTPTLTDCLFNWAEHNYPDFLFPSGTTTQLYAPYAYRYYKDTNSHLSVSFTDDEVYYLGSNGVLQDIGALSGWLEQAKCR